MCKYLNLYEYEDTNLAFMNVEADIALPTFDDGSVNPHIQMIRGLHRIIRLRPHREDNNI